MSESTLSLNYSQLYAEVSDFLGFGRTVPNADPTADARIDSAIQSGLRQFYNPPPTVKGEPPHSWSFLQPVASLITAQGQSNYSLSDNFGGLIGDLTYPSPKPAQRGITGQNRVAIIAEMQIRTVLAGNSKQGAPAYCAVRPLMPDAGGTGGTRWQLVIYPIPDAAYTLNYAYQTIPEKVSLANPYPVGGAVHAETILESCLACAESRDDDNATTHHQTLFTGLLAQSVRLDKQVQATTTSSPWPVAPAHGGLGLHYRELLSQVGDFLEFGWDPNTWSHEEFNFSHATVQEGLRKFYYPKALGRDSLVYEWSFLRPEITVTTNATQSDYPLPPHFAHFIGELAITSPTNGYMPLKMLSLGQIRRLQGEPLAGGIPKCYAVVPRAVDGKSEPQYTLVCYPTPDNAYTLTGRIKAIPPELNDDNPYPLGGVEHAETIRTACLMAAELRHIQLKPPTPFGRGRRVWIPRPQQDELNDRLMASIGLDEKCKPESLGHNGNGRRIGRRSDYSAAETTLTYDGVPLG